MANDKKRRLLRFGGNGSKKDSLASTVLKAVAIGLLVSTVMLLLFSFILSKKDIPFMLLVPYTSLCIALSCCTAGYLAAKKTREKGLLIGALCGASIFLFLITFSLQQSPSITIIAPVKFAIATASGAIGGIFGVNSYVK